MQDADHADASFVSAVDNDMRTHQVKPVGFREIVPAVPKQRIAANGQQCLVNLVPVCLKLIRTPCLAGVTQNIDEVLSCLG